MCFVGKSLAVQVSPLAIYESFKGSWFKFWQQLTDFPILAPVDEILFVKSFLFIKSGILVHLLVNATLWRLLVGRF